MKRLLTIAILLTLSAAAYAQSKPCEELKAEITKKLDDKGVQGYTLEIVEKGKDAERKTVGTCEGGTKKIVYTRGSRPEEPKPAAKKEK